MKQWNLKILTKYQTDANSLLQRKEKKVWDKFESNIKIA